MFKHKSDLMWPSMIFEVALNQMKDICVFMIIICVFSIVFAVSLSLKGNRENKIKLIAIASKSKTER